MSETLLPYSLFLSWSVIPEVSDVSVMQLTLLSSNSSTRAKTGIKCKAKEAINT